MKQRTLKASFCLSGKGLHSGKTVHMVCKPATANHGIKFQRTDLDENPVIDALASNVGDTVRGTFLKNYKNVEVKTIEHLLAALAGNGIYNALIEINGEEVPILDGSSHFFIEAIQKVGIEELDCEQSCYQLRETIRIVNNDSGSEIILIPSDSFSLDVLVDYKTSTLGCQNATLSAMEHFNEQIGICRTFCFLGDILPLIKKDLIKGGDIDNALIYIDKPLDESQEKEICTFFGKDKASINKEGRLDNLTLHFDNEVARHKLLDVLGDLALVGKPILAHVIAKYPSHSLNTKAAKALFDLVKKEHTSPYFDLNKEPLYTIEDIKKRLPHRPPFLLVDKVIELTEERIVGVKNVTMNEPHFVGHFPEEALMPGVLIMEGLAQTGGILVLSNVDEPERYSTYFLKMDQVRFRHKVVPGDTLVYEMRLLEPVRRGLCHMYGRAFVNGQIVAEGDLMAQVIKNK